MPNVQRERGLQTIVDPKPGEYGTTKQLLLQPGDIVVVSGAAKRHERRYVTQGRWGEKNTLGTVSVGRVLRPADLTIASPYGEEGRTQFVIEAGFTSDPYDLEVGHITTGAVDSVDRSFRGLTLLRRGNPPQDGKDGTTTYRLKTLDGRMSLVVTETRREGASTFEIAIDERISLWDRVRRGLKAGIDRLASAKSTRRLLESPK